LTLKELYTHQETLTSNYKYCCKYNF